MPKPTLFSSCAHALFAILFFIIASGNTNAQCNGDTALCTRPYDQVCYVTTHNAFNYNGPFFFPNQTYPVSQQLTDGVRALMLDVYWYNNRPTVYHSSNFLGNQPLADLLSDIKTFLDQHPAEVVTIIFESYITAAQMDAVFQQTSLLPYLHIQPLGQPWPTLNTMIQSGKRLVVFTDDSNTTGYDWYHYMWDYAVETHYSAHSRTDLSCEFNRGDSTNSLFILNHFVTQVPLGYGLIDSAQAINSNPYLQSRTMSCWAQTGKMPNFLTVDFYERGDVFAVANAVNTGLVHTAPPQPFSTLEATLFPNPTQDQVNISLSYPAKHPIHLSLYDLQGRLYHQATFPPAASITLSLHDLPLPAGLYTLKLNTGSQQTTRSLHLLPR